VFDTGRPLLMVPCSSPTDLFFHPIIAWNGSTEAARAVTCAIPLLTRVQGQVDIFTAVEAKHDTNPEELLRYLNWHGAEGKEIAINDTSHSVAENLFAHCEIRASWPDRNGRLYARALSTVHVWWRYATCDATR
jgi:hypothetical protein